MSSSASWGSLNALTATSGTARRIFSGQEGSASGASSRILKLMGISDPGSSPPRSVEVHRHILPLREAVQHAFERELPADAALLVPAVGGAGKLTEALIPFTIPRVAARYGAIPRRHASCGIAGTTALWSA